MKTQVNRMLLIAISELSAVRKIHCIHSATNSKVKGILCNPPLTELEYNAINRALSDIDYWLKIRAREGHEVFTLKKKAQTMPEPTNLATDRLL